MYILNCASTIATLTCNSPVQRLARSLTIDAHRFADSGLVDVHTHAIDDELPDLRQAYPRDRWPSVERTSETDALLTFGGVPYRRIDHRCWSADARLADMDREDVAVQVLSPIPVTFCYQASAAGAAELASAQNEFFARIIRAAPNPLRSAGRRRAAGPRRRHRRDAAVHAPSWIPRCRDRHAGRRDRTGRPEPGPVLRRRARTRRPGPGPSQ